jgi:DNA repair protein RadC
MVEYKSSIDMISLKRERSGIKKAKIGSSRDSYDYIRQFYFDDISIYESFFLLLMNRANNVIGYAKISQGGVYGTVVDKKIICKYCIDTMASSAIISHNHPSGNTNPSEADRRITREIREALKVFDVQLLDHIIVCEEDFYSFADNGLI